VTSIEKKKGNLAESEKQKLRRTNRKNTVGDQSTEPEKKRNDKKTIDRRGGILGVATWRVAWGGGGGRLRQTARKKRGGCCLTKGKGEITNSK